MGTAATIGFDLIALYGPQLLKQAIDLLASDQANLKHLFRIAGYMVLLAAGIAVLSAISEPLFYAFARRVERNIRKAFFTHLVKLPQKTMDKHPAGEMMTRATYDLNNIQMAVGHGVQDALDSSFILVLALGYMIFMSPFLTLLSAIPLLTIPWLTRRQSIRYHECHKDIQQSFENLTEVSRNALNAIRLIKVFDLISTKNQQFSEKAHTLFDSNLELVKISALYVPVMSLITHLSQAIVWGVGGAMAVLGEISPGEVVAFSLYLAMVKTPLIYFGYLINLSQRYKSSKNRMDEILTKQIEDIVPNTFASPLSCEKDIHIRNLSFTYPEESQPTLSNVTMTIPNRSTSALVGPVGSGKSTLFRLITRIWEPPKGTIFLGEKDITELPLSQYRECLELTSQEPFVFSGSVRENIALASGRINEKAFNNAVERVALKDEVASLPKGLDTVLGEKGQRLSGGQRARVALAGTLLRNRPILLLDDPLSAVDSPIEADILKNLVQLRNQQTTMIISHRPLSLSVCRRIFVLENGRMVNSGTYDELIRSSETYQQLVLKQELSLKIKGFMS